MSMTEDEYAYDEYMSELYEEHKQQAIEEFTFERLQSYYDQNRLLAKPALNALIEARTLEPIDSTAGFIFASIAMEVGLKETLLKPIVSGLVHTESIAALITNLVISHQSMDRYRDLLLQILREHAGVDLDTYSRPGAARPIWEEIREVQKRRNSIVHRAAPASPDEAAMALGVASSIIEQLFPDVVKKMGLHLREGLRICDDWKCQYEGTPTGEALKKIRI